MIVIKMKLFHFHSIWFILNVESWAKQLGPFNTSTGSDVPLWCHAQSRTYIWRTTSWWEQYQLLIFTLILQLTPMQMNVKSLSYLNNKKYNVSLPWYFH